MLRDAQEKAGAHFQTQLMDAMKGAVLNDGYGDVIANMFEDINSLKSVEFIFMWGWHHEYAKNAGDWPTSPSGRASTHMMRYLMDRHGFSAEAAIDEGRSLDKSWNEADPVFDAIASCGEKSFHEPSLPWFYQALRFVAEATADSDQQGNDR